MIALLIAVLGLICIVAGVADVLLTDLTLGVHWAIAIGLGVVLLIVAAGLDGRIGRGSL